MVTMNSCIRSAVPLYFYSLWFPPFHLYIISIFTIYSCLHRSVECYFDFTRKACGPNL